GGRFTWKRVLVASSDKQLIIFSESLPMRLFAWFHNLFFGDFYAKTLKVKHIRFLAASDLPQSAKKGDELAKPILDNTPKPNPVPPPVGTPPILHPTSPASPPEVPQKKLSHAELTQLLDSYQKAGVSEQQAWSREILQLLPTIDRFSPLTAVQELALVE